MTTPHIIIETLPTDAHGHALVWSLALRGVTAHLLHSEHFADRAALGIRITDGGNAQVRYEGPEGSIRVTTDEPVVYWMRRQGVQVPAAGLDEDDRPAAIRENQATIAGFRQLLAQGSGNVFLNPLAARARAESKPVQLQLARSVGMQVPRTLFSNAPDDILAFIEDEGGVVVAKTHTPLIWRQPTDRGHRSAMAYSFRLDADQVRQSPSLRWCAGIYQQLLPKQFEARVTMFGTSCFGTRLESQAVASAELDWRAGQAQVAMTPMEIPEHVQAQCRAYLDAAGLLMGCFDFVIDPDGTWHFLECNEQGQWLWQEARCPDLHLLAAFTDFIQAPSRTFQHIPADSDVRAGQYRESRWPTDMRAMTAGVGVRQGANVLVERVRAA